MRLLLAGAAQQKERLLEQARKRHGAIEPCAGKSWGQCFTRLPSDELALWFNLPNGSTAILRESELSSGAAAGAAHG
jgi:hypothetical protein